MTAIYSVHTVLRLDGVAELRNLHIRRRQGACTPARAASTGVRQMDEVCVAREVSRDAKGHPPAPPTQHAAAGQMSLPHLRSMKTSLANESKRTRLSRPEPNDSLRVQQW